MQKLQFDMLSLCLILATSAFVATGQIFWKLAVVRAAGALTLTATSVASLVFSGWFMFGCLAYVIGVGFWLLQLSRLPLSTAFAATTGFVFLATLAADALLFGTPLMLSRLAGGALVMIGILLSIAK